VKAHLVDHKFGAISSTDTIRIEATPEELAQLREALATVDKFKTVAYRLAHAKDGPKGSDWTTVGYSVKTDCVIVTVRQGMAG
jgi:hypothetical protein